MVFTAQNTKQPRKTDIKDRIRAKNTKLTPQQCGIFFCIKLDIHQKTILTKIKKNKT